MTSTLPLAFTPTPRPRRLVTVAVLSVVAAVITGHGALVVLAVGPLVLLALSPRSGLPPSVDVEVAQSTAACVEDDDVELTVTVVVPGADRVELAVRTPPHVDVTRVEPVRLRRGRHSTTGSTTTYAVVPRRWGRYRNGRVQVRVVAGHGSYTATVSVPLPGLVVYPGGAVRARPVAPRELPARLGDHASRALGSGLEFTGIRTYAHGDRRRDIDWRASARWGALHVRQYAAERPVDLVVVLDVTADAGEPGSSTLDLGVRAAMGLAATYLAVADRVGLVTLGPSVRWVPPSGGPRQRQRFAESLLQVRDDESQVGGGIGLVPRAAFPAGAFVCFLSPLLDDRAVEAVRDLHVLGHGLLVVDVLTTEPAPPPHSPMGDLPLRVWRMEREATRAELAGLGVPLLAWDGSGDLASALLHAMRSVRPEVRA